MRVFIPTKNRQETIVTHQAFAGMPVTILVHDEEQRAAYLRNVTVDPKTVVVSGVPGDTFGLTRQREFACRHLAEPGEWFVFADDNIQGLTAVTEEYWGKAVDPSIKSQSAPDWQQVFNAPCGTDRFERLANECVETATKIGAHLVGFALTNNAFFRGKKYRGVGYVIGKMMLWHNVPFAWDHTISMEDFRNTGEHLLRFGRLLINNYIFPSCKHYQSGGMGTYNERVPIRQQDVQRLLTTYPGLFRAKDRKGFVKNTDLSVRFTSWKQVKVWREDMVRGGRWDGTTGLEGWDGKARW